MKNDNLKSRIATWVSGRNTSGVNGTALLLEAVHYVVDHGDKTLLARMAAINEKSTARNIKDILAAFGFKAVSDKKQPSGIRIDAIRPDGGPADWKWSLDNHKLSLRKLEQARDEKLSIAGKRIVSAEFFMTDKAREAAAKREAEEAQAQKEAEEMDQAEPVRQDPAPAVVPAADVDAVVAQFALLGDIAAMEEAFAAIGRMMVAKREPLVMIEDQRQVA